MSKKGSLRKRQTNSRTSVASSNFLEGLTLQELEIMSKAAPLALQNKLEKSLTSESFDEVIKAQAFITEVNKNAKRVPEPDIKSILWNPSQIGFTGKGYKDPTNGVSFNTLNRMGDIFIIKAVINTRIEQVQNFLKYSNDEQKPGYKIRLKRNATDVIEKIDTQHLKKSDCQIVEKIVKFLEEGGENDKWACEDNFQDFTRKVLSDSLRLDQMCFEIVRSRNMELKKFRAIDGALVRQLDTTDPRHSEIFEELRWKGYLPKYAMVWDGQIIKHPITAESVIFYPWELGYGVRNKSSNVMRNGYGCSELETLIEIVTWVLWGMQYNGNFFKQGSQPKGFINVKNNNVDQGTLNEFRQEWKQTMSSVYNAHKVPIIQGIDLEWIDLQQTNKDMEFTEWLKFLLVLVCSVYRIDPSELGFRFTENTMSFGGDGQKERLSHSKQKGLTPLLIFYQNVLNKYIISEIDERFELFFTGIEIEDEEAQVELDVKKIQNGMVSMEDMFIKYSGRQFDKEKDTILNSIYQGIITQKLMGGSDMNGMVDGEESSEVGSEEGSPGANDNELDIQKAISTNPILSSAMDYINNELFKI